MSDAAAAAAAASRLQATWRGGRTRAALDRELGAMDTRVVSMQAAWRGALLRRGIASAARQLAADEAAARLQAAYRGRLVRDDMLIQHIAAVDIQKRWRGHEARIQTAAPAVDAGSRRPHPYPAPLVLRGPGGATATLCGSASQLVVGRGVLGLPDHSRLHRKHVLVSWDERQQTWVLQKMGKNPGYLLQSAADDVESLPPAPHTVAVSAGDVLYL
eukprot:COSAG05_NODE_1071_length_5964_cov_6.578005_3_plen_216_part_00